MIVVYLAGPIRGAPGDNQFQHVHSALADAKKLRDAGFCVLVPQRCVLDEVVFGAVDVARWLEEDYELIRRADVLCRRPGPSLGSDSEVAFAREIGKPVVLGVETLLARAAELRDRLDAAAFLDGIS